MELLLAQLEQIDSQLLALLQKDDVDSAQMARLLDERKTCLAQITAFPAAPEKEAWSSAVLRTEQLLKLIKTHRDGAAAQASNYKKGRKSVQIYKKFE